MSDQEPLGKRMLGQLYEHTKPYQRDAWKDFERFRAAKGRKRRMLFYYLSAAALVIILGAALLTNRIINRGNITKHGIAKKEIGSNTSPDREKRHQPNASDGESVAKKAENHTNRRNGLSPNRQNPADFATALATEVADAPTDRQAPAPDRAADELSPGLIQPLPFRSSIVRFGKVQIRVGRESMDAPARPARPIRFGIGVSQQSNRAAHTSRELNYGVGGSLAIPLSTRMAFVTGLYGSKQSLNVEEPAVLVASAGAAQLQRVRYHWVNLEVPLQVQYRLKTYKMLGINAIGGISLQSSIRQEADYLYKTSRTISTFSETPGGPVLVSTQTVEELSTTTQRDHKGEWALATPIYLGLGFHYRLQNTAVELEPYVKYPIGPTTAERLQLTSVGVQLRLTVGSKH
nr:hypothetical protein [uncultured Dyadobacter sp.]